MRKSILTLVSLLALSSTSFAQGTDWYPATNENKPFVRWWWHGSAVDKPGLSWNLEEFARAGIGGVEITPIYGVKGNESADLPFLSEKWMEMYKFTVAKAASLGLEVDMNCGTGWPFGGPETTPESAAKKMVINEEGRILAEPTGQMVKRAAPGGEGLVINHYDSLALKNYLEKFDKAFSVSGAPYPRFWFNDSYEVYGADWTEGLPEYFKARYGYDIEDALLNYTGEKRSRALCDYRECLGELLRENFYKPWIEWAHSHGSLVRNQSHGSPANILDLYALVDIPETETFGRSDFNIPGLRRDPVTRHNDGDPSALKFASSAAHLTGKKYVSCEILTWLTEHFRTSLSQCKPELDRAFCAGVNHIVFHGAAYTPYGTEFPGWHFYAAVNMSPTSSMWKDAPALFKYAERCQAFLTAGEADSDFLLYMPVYDAWSKDSTGKAYMMFDIHGMNRTIPELKKAMDAVNAAGFDADYISDSLLSECDIDRPVLVPACRYMPLKTAERLLELKKKGIPVHFIGCLPEDIPGLSGTEAQRKEFKRIVSQFGKAVKLEKALQRYRPETFRTELGGSLIRRKNEAGGYNYFVSMLDDRKVDAWVKLATEAASAVIFNPMDGTRGKAELRRAADGCAEVRIQLDPGQSLMIKTFPDEVTMTERWNYVKAKGEDRTLDSGWLVSFPESSPAIPGEYYLGSPRSWTTLDVPEAKINRATATYRTSFQLDPSSADGWELNLGDVRESASVYVNGNYVATLVSVPFKVEIGKWLKKGINNLEVRVTNMDSNRISDLDRRGVEWRIFKDANVNSISGGAFNSEDWETDPSGLISEVKLTPLYHDRSGATAGRKPVFEQKYDTRKQKPFEISVPVPDGNYLVSVTLGDRRRASETSIKAESRRLCVMAEKTVRGEEKTLTFLVNKRDRSIRKDGQLIGSVRTKSREERKLDWDDCITLEILGSAPAVSSITIEPADDVTTIYLCGDSTVVDQDNEPWASWGQMAPFFLDDRVAVANYAESGERTDSFIASRRLEKILSLLKPGDYVFVEFGHNDMKLKGPDKNGYCFFADMLREFISSAREKGACPVLVTPTHRRNFDAEGKIVETHADYPDGMRYVASRESVPLIELHGMSGEFYESLGPEGSKKAFVHYPAGAYPGMTKAVEDNTHFSAYGAFELAKRVMGAVRVQIPGLSAHILNTEATMIWHDSPYRDMSPQVSEKDDQATPLK